MENIKNIIRDIPDFPTEGILFRDITPLLQHGGMFADTINIFRDRYANKGIDKIAAVESRGFFFASPLAYALGCGLVPLRKPGKLPHETINQSYKLEYGEAALEIHTDAIDKNEKILVFDDLLATGGTARAAVELTRKLGGRVIEAAFVVELCALGGKDRLEDLPVFSLLKYE